MLPKRLLRLTHTTERKQVMTQTQLGTRNAGEQLAYIIKPEDTNLGVALVKPIPISHSDYMREVGVLAVNCPPECVLCDDISDGEPARFYKVTRVLSENSGFNIYSFDSDSVENVVTAMKQTLGSVNWFADNFIKPSTTPNIEVSEKDYVLFLVESGKSPAETITRAYLETCFNI